MQDILNGLRKDHRNILRLLDAFARELSLLEADGEPDYELLDDILRYSLDYPDEELRSAALDILNLLRHLLDGQDVDRVVFSRNCRCFIQSYQRHIRREEALLFPLVEDVLSTGENFNIPRVTKEPAGSGEFLDSVRGARLRLVVSVPD